MAVDSSINVILGATLGPLKKGLKQGVGLVKGFSATASKAIVGGGIGNAIAGALGGATATAAIGYSLKQFAELQSASMRLTGALKASGNQAGVTTAQVKTYAAQMLQATGTAKTATMAAAAGLAKFDQVKGPNFQATISAAADYAAVVGGDVVGATEKFGAALQNPKEGVLELAAAGVAFTGAQLQAIQAMTDAGDIAGAQGVILEALQAQFGGAAEAAGNTLGGSLEKLWGGFNDVAAIVGEAVAPAIKSAVDMFQTWLGGIDQQATKLAVLDAVATVTNVIVDGVQALGIAWKAAQVGMDALLLVGVKGFRLLMQGIQACVDGLAAMGVIEGSTARGFTEFVEGVKQFEAGVGKTLEDDAKSLSDAWQKPWNSQTTKTFFSQIRSESAKAGKEMGDAIAGGAKKAETAVKQLSKVQIAAHGEAMNLIRDLKVQNDTFGQADWMKNANALKAKLGDSDQGQSDQVRKLGAQLAGKELAVSLETPFEKFTREMKKLTDLQAAGGLDAETFARAKSSLTKNLMDAVPQVKASAGGALMQGSQEARSALLAYRNSGRGANPQEQMLRVAEEQRKQQEITNRYLGQMAKAAAPTPTAAPNAPGFN